MWLRKTPDDHKADHERKYRGHLNPLGPLIVAPFLGLLVLIEKQSWGAYAFGVLVMFVMCYAGQILFGNDFDLWGYGPPDGNYICPHCQKYQAPNKESKCIVCGAELEKLAGWKWLPKAKGRKELRRHVAESKAPNLNDPQP